MRRYATMSSFPALLLLGGCYQDLIEMGAGLVPDTLGSTSTGEPPIDETPTSSATLGLQTATGYQPTGEPDTWDASAGEPANVPPKIDAFEVKPDHLGEAGPAQLRLVASADVVTVRLTLDGTTLADLTPADFPYTWHAVSAADNGPMREFRVVVADAEGLEATAADPLSVQLPASGVTRCAFEDPQKGVVTSSITALEYTPGAIFAVGARDTGAGLRLTVWALDPDHCEVVLPGWPRSVTSWTGDDALGQSPSIGTAVDLDAHGNIVVAGNLLVAGKPQSYVALLNPGGSRLWEQTGQPGDEVTSVAAATGQYADRIFVGGARRTNDNPVRTDAAIWIYQSNGPAVFVAAPDILAAPFSKDEQPDADNDLSESVRAVIVQPNTNNALAVGERALKTDPDHIFTRAFTAQIHPLGGINDVPWTSWAPAFKHDAVRSVTFCGDHVLAAGWTRDEVPDVKPQPMMFWLAGDGKATQHRHEPQLGATQINGIACDREGKIVSAATRDWPSRDAQVFTVRDQYGLRTMYETGVADDDAAGAIACDWRGFCAWGGYRTSNGKPFAVVRVHHP